MVDVVGAGNASVFSPPRRRGKLTTMSRPFQFSLRALLVSVLLVATFFGGMQFGERREKDRRDREEQAKLIREQAERDREFEKLATQFMDQEVKANAGKAIRRFVEEMKPEELGLKRPNGPRLSEPKQTSAKRRLIDSTLDKVDSPRLLTNPS